MNKSCLNFEGWNDITFFMSPYLNELKLINHKIIIIHFAAWCGKCNLLVGICLFVGPLMNAIVDLDAVLIMICQIIKLFFGIAYFNVFLERALVFGREAVGIVILMTSNS